MNLQGNDQERPQDCWRTQNGSKWSPPGQSGPFSGRVRTRQGTEICNFGAPSPLDFPGFSPVDFSPFSPSCLCKLVRKAPQNVEKIARFPDGEKGAESCHVCGCHGSFGPDILVSPILEIVVRSEAILTKLCLEPFWSGAPSFRQYIGHSLNDFDVQPQWYLKTCSLQIGLLLDRAEALGTAPAP